MAWPNAQTGKKSLKSSEQRGRRTYLKCGIHSHAGFVPAFWPHSCTTKVQPLSHGEGTSEQAVGSPRCGPQLTLLCSVWCRTAGEVWPGRVIPTPSSSLASPPWEEECRVLSPSQGPALLPPLLSLPKPSPPLPGAGPSPTPLQALLHPELPASLPGLWCLPAPGEDAEGHATLSGHHLACNELTPYCSIFSPLCADCIIIIDKRHICWWTRDRSSLHLSCTGLVSILWVLQKTPAFAEMLCTPWCGFSGTHQGPLGIPREVWGLVTMLAQQKPAISLPRMCQGPRRWEKAQRDRSHSYPPITRCSSEQTPWGAQVHGHQRESLCEAEQAWLEEGKDVSSISIIHCSDRMGSNGESSQANTRAAADPLGSGGAQSWDRVILGLQPSVMSSYWGWERANSGKESWDFPTSQLNSHSLKSTGTINQTSYCKPVVDNKEMSNNQPGFVRSKVCHTI